MVNVNKSVRGAAAAAALLSIGALVQPAQATIILEGSDAIGYHSFPGDVDAIAYRDQVWTALGGSDSRSIAVIGADPVSAGAIISGTHAITRFQTTGAAGDLSNYAAVYFLAGGGCCFEDNTLVDDASEKAAVSTYLGAGGTVMIEDYVGGAEWDFALGTSGGAVSHVAGYTPAGGAGGSTGSDHETVTADGLLNGFTQPSPMSYWTHQAYDNAFFGALGFTTSYFTAGTDVHGDGWSALLSNGKTVTGVDNSTPEPGSLVLLGLGLAGIGFARRRKASK